jgi:hypothetical protein
VEDGGGGEEGVDRVEALFDLRGGAQVQSPTHAVARTSSLTQLTELSLSKALVAGGFNANAVNSNQLKT